MYVLVWLTLVGHDWGTSPTKSLANRLQKSLWPGKQSSMFISSFSQRVAYFPIHSHPMSWRHVNVMRCYRYAIFTDCFSIINLAQI